MTAVVQARLSSSRLPRKVLADLGGEPLLLVLLSRLSDAKLVDEVVVAVPDVAIEDELAAAVGEWGYRVTRGPLDDVLTRYQEAARQSRASLVVRVTGDCPLVDPRLVDRVVSTLLERPELDYVALDETHADGADCEAFTIDALEAAAQDATLPSDREHVTQYIRRHPEQFAICELSNHRDDGDVRLTVDEPADLDVVRSLVARLGMSPDVGLDAYVDALRAGGDHGDRRDWVTRNEGLWRSRNRDDVARIGLVNGRSQSDAWLARAVQVIPSATQTLSKARNQFVEGVTPSFLRSGSGCHVTDVDGNIFIDYPMALGPIILGYNHPRTVQAVQRQIVEGSTFTLPHPLEVEVAELVTESVPSAEMVRFAKNGSDVTDAAVRLARAITGRDVVLASGYHGWHDWYVVQTPRSAGVPDVLRPFIDTFQFNDLDAFQAALDRHADKVGAVILEVPFDDPLPGYLEELRERTHRAGAVLIYDEIVTGFRFSLGGAQELYGVAPDLTCLGKSMANGLPLSAIAGRRELMEDFDRIFFSGTFGGETLSLAAAHATISQIRDAPVVEHIWAEGKRLHDGIRAAIDRSRLEIELIGQPPRGALMFRRDGEEWPALRGLFLQETVKRGVLFGGPIFVTYAHDAADIDATLWVVDEALDVLRAAVEADSVERQLEGPAPGVVFRLARS